MKKILISILILILVLAGGAGAAYFSYVKPAIQVGNAINENPVMKGTVAISLDGEKTKFHIYKDSDDVYLKTEDVVDYALDQMKQDGTDETLIKGISTAFDYADQDSYLSAKLITGIAGIDFDSNSLFGSSNSSNGNGSSSDNSVDMRFMPVFSSKKVVKNSAFKSDIEDMRFVKGRVNKSSQMYVGFPKDSSDKRVYFSNSEMEGVMEYDGVKLPKNILTKDMIPDSIWNALEEAAQ